MVAFKQWLRATALVCLAWANQGAWAQQACPDQSAPGDGRTSAVLSNTVFDSGSGLYIYNFTVCNTSAPGSRTNPTHLLRDWELPFDPAGILGAVAPLGWGVQIETIGDANAATGWDGLAPTWFNPLDAFHDPRYLGLNQVLHFYTCQFISETEDFNCATEEDFVEGDPLRPGESLSGFRLVSAYGPTNAPYQASWEDLPPRSGDPDFPLVGPNSPGLRNTVPEPLSLMLLALGLAALRITRRR